MFVYWPWIGLIAACALIVAILSIRLAGRVNLRPLDEIRPEQHQDVNYGEPMTDPYISDQLSGVGYATGGSISGGGDFQDPDCSIQFQEMTPSEMGGYPPSQGEYPPSQASGYPPSMSGHTSSRNEHML